VAIFYMDVKIIGRGSGRSATGAAAYRSGQKLRSMAHASYQSGERLQGRGGTDGKITHDYTRKKGVVHSEIILPINAPTEFLDRETLWNAVEISETRKNSQLAREIIVALPREFDLREQLEVVRGYVKENFVSKGMIADFAIHDKGDGNPHAHIMLTTRNVSPDGFRDKNRDWNKKENLLEWRKAWTHIINNTFERKGLSERIDHRTLKEQGFDRKPFIHMGHETAALEKKGIKTERGDYNREIKRHNDERAKKEAEIMELQETVRDIRELQQVTIQGIKLQQQQQEAMMQIITALQQQSVKPLEKAELMESNANTTAGAVPNEVRTTLTTASRMSEPQEAHINPPEKLSPIPKKKKPTVIETSKHMEKIRQKYDYANLDWQHRKSSRNVVDSEIFYMKSEIEEIDEAVKNIQTLRDRVVQLEAEQQRQHFWNWKRKKELEEEIRQTRQKLLRAQHTFIKFYNAAPEETPAKTARIQKKIEINEAKIPDMDKEIVKAEKKMEAIKQEYDQYKLEFNIRVRRKVKKQPDLSAELTQTTDRQSVRERLQEFRRPAEERKQRKAAVEKLRAIKPIKFLMIASPGQKKRSLGDVLGKYYRKINGRVYPSVPPAKVKNQKIW